MNRSARLLLLYFCSMGLLVGLLGWLTASCLRLESAQRTMTVQAESERLALWRMESISSSLLMREAVRPAAYWEISSDDQLIADDFILERFTVRPDHSPQDPPAKDPPSNKPTRWSWELSELIPESLQQPTAIELDLNADPPNPFQQEPAPNAMPNEYATNGLEQRLNYDQYSQQIQRSQTEYQSRQRTVLDNNFRNTLYLQSFGTEDRLGHPHPRWIDDELLLLRRAWWEGEPIVQGAVFDWDRLRTALLSEVRPLLPEANLVPAGGREPSEGTTDLVTLPIQLAPGSVPEVAVTGWTPLRVSLATGWAALIFATLAVGGALWTAIRLGERRGTFVSAVTHELRTPLTTFRLYTEMLESEMVPAERRTDYLETMRLEAERLEHLIENVLSYSRLERDRRAVSREPIDLGELIERLKSPLTELAARREMRLAVNLPEESESLIASTDRGAVERILFNLVDNAGKYGSAGDRNDIVIEAGRNGGSVWLAVRDYGPGLSPEMRRRLFRPFSKSASEAAITAPGVGLGLALCRRLARRLGGDLRLDPDTDEGARFLLELPG